MTAPARPIRLPRYPLPALHEGTWPDGLSECPCGTGECEGPEGEYRTCSACGGHIYIWEAPEALAGAAESEAA